MPQRVGWKPCLCSGAQEGAEQGRGMGHLWILCVACHEEGRETMLYEPPHDPEYRAPGPWQPPSLELDAPRRKEAPAGAFPEAGASLCAASAATRSPAVLGPAWVVAVIACVVVHDCRAELFGSIGRPA